MQLLSREEFYSDLHNARKRGVLKTVKNGYTVVETVYQNLYSGNLWVQVDITYGDGSVSDHYAEYELESEIIEYAKRLQQQKQEAE